MTDDQAGRRLYGPFNRVEGDLEVEISIQDGRVAAAWVNSPLFRGFEQILQGKDPRDALVYTPRICGICSVAQSVAAATALADAQGLTPARNGQLATNLVLAAENLADHLSHFYLFFMPDFAREAYQDHTWHTEIRQLYRAQTGTRAPEMLRARAELLHITALLAGKWPHTLAIQPGGSSCSITGAEKARLFSMAGGIRRFLEQYCFTDTLENMLQLHTPQQLLAWAEQHPQADFARFINIADELALDQLGVLTPRLMSYGAYPGADGFYFARGVWVQQHQPFDPRLIREDISHSWMQVQQQPSHPFQGSTLPDPEQPDGYSWCKAPRLDGQVMEVGALARQVINGQPLLQHLVSESQSNVRNRVLARVLEMAALPLMMQQLIRELQPGATFCHHAPLPGEAEGQGLVEAARGSLGHWLRIRNGRILNYQIIAPTTWNFSPRDGNDTPGVLEQALVGTAVGDQGQDSLAIQHIVRSFDPCMVCTVH